MGLNSLCGLRPKLVLLFRYNRDAWLNFTEHGTAEQYDPAPDLSAQSLTNVYYELCQSLLSDEKKKKKTVKHGEM